MKDDMERMESGGETISIHLTAEVHPDAQIGEGTKIWNEAQVREGAVIGRNCVIGKNVYVDKGVHIGDFVRIQNNVSVYHGVTIEDGVFVGPHVCFTNDHQPRAVNENFEPVAEGDWEVAPTLIEKGASIGANSTIIAPARIGTWAMVGAGSVVTKDIPEFSLAYGNPAKIRGRVNEAGEVIERTSE